MILLRFENNLTKQLILSQLNSNESVVGTTNFSTFSTKYTNIFNHESGFDLIMHLQGILNMGAMYSARDRNMNYIFFLMKVGLS
jgi:hypothetical protein